MVIGLYFVLVRLLQSHVILHVYIYTRYITRPVETNSTNFDSNDGTLFIDRNFGKQIK